MMSDFVTMPPPLLEPRFLQPQGWRWHVFRNRKGRKLRFGCVTPKDKIPEATFVCLPGRGEFAEKYFEFAHDCLDRNIAFWVIDWCGQGGSDRGLKNPHKHHLDSFDDDVEDLHLFLNEYVRHSSVHPDVGQIPLVLIGHSMGGMIGMRYIQRYPNMFCCAVLSAPMTRIKAIAALPDVVAGMLSGMLGLFLGCRYVWGGGDWSAAERDDPARNIFSHDPVRAAVHNAWCLHSPALQLGGVTFGWVRAAVRACARLKRDMKKSPIRVPCLFALAGEDILVDNDRTRMLAGMIEGAEILEFPGAMHEILMERDAVRDRFWAGIMGLLEKNHIRDQLKPF